jgi:hypothetical protein
VPSVACVQLFSSSHPNRIHVFHAVASIAATQLPRRSFQKGYYYNPEVAVMQFLNASTTQYDFAWLIESDVRWTVSMPSCTPQHMHAAPCGRCWSHKL